ncbi:MAG: hypothetical protein JWN71_4063 [Xanthobacteraceae bacterium]|nr:hypothetical protein [Xanthobacteraceae bacterium]
MIKRLLLTTAIGLALSTAAFAQTAADPSKTETDKPAATQTATTPAPASVTLSAGVSVTEPDRTRITESVARMSVKPLRGVDFSVSVGSRVPRELRVYRLPADVVQIVPQYRDYRFLVVDKDIVIVEPSANKIVTILPRDPSITTATVTAAPPPATVTPAAAAPTTAAPTHPASTTATTSTTSTSTASAPAPSTSPTPALAPEQPSAQSSQASAEPDRPKVKTQASRPQRMSRAARDDRRRAHAEVRVGQRVPDGVVLYDLPPSLYREMPAAREYRTTQQGPRSYVAGPRSRVYYPYD